MASRVVTAMAVALALLPLGRAEPQGRGAPLLAPLFERLRASSQQVTTLTGEFTQRNRVSLFREELRSRGRFAFRRPRQIRWEYLEPDPSTLVLDGTHAVLKSPGQPTQLFDLERDPTVGAIFSQLLLWLGPDSPEALERDYRVTAAGTAAEPVLVLAPKTGPIARAFRRIELRLDGRSLLLRALLLVEQNGDEKELTFTKLERNVSLPKETFAAPK